METLLSNDSKWGNKMPNETKETPYYAISNEQKSIYKGILVFDLDCTLTVRHFYAYLHNKEYFIKMCKDNNENIENTPMIIRYDEFKDLILNEQQPTDEQKKIIINYFFGGEYRLNLLCRELRILRKSGITIMILSNGREKDIKSLCKMVNLIQYFKHIYGTDMKKQVNTIALGRSPEGKTYKEVILSQLPGTYKNIYYVDDIDTEHKIFINYFNNDLHP